MKIEIITNIHYNKIRIFNAHLIMVKYENNWTLSPHGRCDFLIAQFHGRCDFLFATLAEHIKNSIFYNRITLNTIRKKYPCTEKKQNPNVTKFKKKSRKMLEFRTKNRYKPIPLLEITRVTNVSQTGHKSVTNTSQKRQFSPKVVTFAQEQISQNRRKVNYRNRQITRADNCH